MEKLFPPLVPATVCARYSPALPAMWCRIRHTVRKKVYSQRHTNSGLTQLAGRSIFERSSSAAREKLYLHRTKNFFFSWCRGPRSEKSVKVESFFSSSVLPLPVCATHGMRSRTTGFEALELKASRLYVGGREV